MKDVQGVCTLFYCATFHPPLLCLMFTQLNTGRSYKLGSLQATLSIKGLIGPDLYVSDTQYGRPKVRWEIAAIVDERIIDGAW